MNKFLIIQTAFIGDVILATPVIEALQKKFPEATIDFLLRKGNENLLQEHPHLRKLYVWNKKEGKYKSLLRLSKQIRKEKYDAVINIHRFGSSGFLVFRSGAKQKIGFDKNPFSFSYTTKIHHEIGNGKHEVERNLQLLETLTGRTEEKPRLYLSTENKAKVKAYQDETYICIAPTSVWFTKQFLTHKWKKLIGHYSKKYKIYLLGAPADEKACDALASGEENVVNLAGKLSLMDSAALIKDAKMNFVNDSAPMHLASAMNAPVTAVFCSTVPDFGFGPLSDQSKLVETKEKLECRPCGLHGYKTCPKEHFNCAEKIDIQQLLFD